ncbi:MAG: 30S ribosomal protein S9 [Phycisphaerales bacterium]|jgi:small subunit ribosomal protein S9|nr:30S ribosomal protein S9 [Phycisphaerales bacterium]
MAPENDTKPTAEIKLGTSADTESPKESDAPKTSFSVPVLEDGVHYIFGTGRRKKAVARVRIRPGTGKVLVNKREFSTFFVHEKDRTSALSPLKTTGMTTSLDVWVNVRGGGSTGQADAVKLGLARAIAKAIPDAEHTLRDANLMTRDARIKERKKYGQRGARRRFQFSKR